MSQHTEPEDSDGIELTYSSLPQGAPLDTLLAAHAYDGERVSEEPGPFCAPQGSWPHSYHRPLTVAFLGALFALGALLGTVVSGYAASLHSLPGSATLLSRPTATAAVDARFAIVTLGIQCLPDLCDAPDGSQYVPAGQRVYAVRGDWSCATLSATKVVGRDDQYVYCRLDQSNVFTATFNGAPFDCVGSRLGCHFVVQVETTNGR